MLINGSNFGSPQGPGNATFTLTTGATFVGAAGLTGTANKGILPWAIVDPVVGPSYSFATSDSSTGSAAPTARCCARWLRANTSRR